MKTVKEIIDWLDDRIDVYSHRLKSQIAKGEDTTETKHVQDDLIELREYILRDK